MKLLFDVFLAGSTGYLGRPLGAALARRGHRVQSLVRRGSEHRVPAGTHPIIGDALSAATFADLVPRGAVYVHLVGVAHPSPSKAAEFRSIDLASVEEGLIAAKRANAARFLYVSVAHPAPIMEAYVAARTEAEQRIRASRIPNTILRPWYVLGPGHYWPALLMPLYALASMIPAWRDTSRRLGLVTHSQMIRALIEAVETPAEGDRVIEVPEIRSASPTGLRN
jgi:uncharacterized protein YbjT (DUF2867 family)